MEQERVFWSFVTRAEERHDPDELFVGTPELGARARLEIYANMYVWRPIDALLEDFPKLLGVIGDAAFYALAEDYIRIHPPSIHRSRSLAGISRVS